ncbi:MULTISPECIES: hypothetical protein [unclassified Kitasatospora]|uniref:hypothetical protein n=1 Tax=unclassified Kitasatospora TaxID=2633591 RepID=UPI0033BFDDF6
MSTPLLATSARCGSAALRPLDVLPVGGTADLQAVGGLGGQEAASADDLAGEIGMHAILQSVLGSGAGSDLGCQ